MAAWTPSSYAVETDQYLAWIHPTLRDATATVNSIINRELGVALDQVQSTPEGRELECQELVAALLPHFVASVGIDTAIEQWISGASGTDMLPPLEWGVGRTLEATVYRRVLTYRVAPFSKTIRINAVNIGTDKLGHFFSQGLDYYKAYQNARRNGVIDDEDAVIEAIESGISQEKTIYGFWPGGVFSFADLEANFQGLQFALNLCSGPTPYLERRAGRWGRVRVVDVRAYVNPNWDESFNTSYIMQPYWMLVKPELLGYCPMLKAPSLRSRREEYRARVVENLSTRLLARKIRDGEIDDPAPQRLDAICAEAAAASEH